MHLNRLLSRLFTSIGALALVAPTWIGAIAPSMIGVQPAQAQPVLNQTAQIAWSPTWGTRLIGCAAETATPVFVLDEQAANLGRAVLGKLAAPDQLKNVGTVFELARVALPAQTYVTDFAVKDPISFKDYTISLKIVSDVVAFRTLDIAGTISATGAEHFVWGVHTHCSMVTTETGEKTTVTQPINYFNAYGATSTAANAKIAANSAGAVIAQQPAAAPSCYSQCMAGEHARHFQNMLDCLTAAGVGGGAGASVCILGCLGTGPGYPACVLGCLSAVGVTVGVIGAVCVSSYVAAMLGAAIGCAVGCWTCW